MTDFKKIKLSILFKRLTTLTYSGYNADDLVMDDGTVPVIVNSSKNNGVAGYSNYKALNEGNVITFSDTVNPEETIFYQKNDFIGFSHVNKLIPKFDGFDELVALYVIAAFKRSIKGIYDYNKKFTSEIEEQELVLPIITDTDDKLDLEYIKSYILNIIPAFYEFEGNQIDEMSARKRSKLEDERAFILDKFLER
ncbi:restriction endonuclease subunit S [Streptococcus suis]|uniref:restriction endonuclease subunit S n=1 Tax=Streptococcus suis TaxID=1307 RepID=UPI000CF5D877|nr:restriction endonuclease subunit S [Streptococcus suis]